MVNLINAYSNIGNISAEHLSWAAFGFTLEEDLCLVSSEGVLYLVDPLTGEFRDKPYTLSDEFQVCPILDSKLEDNSLVMRAQNNQFFWVSNVALNP